jgi:glyoxylase-like metal-dependent hydrolase (beta-lactamase superfamily II)
MITKIFLNKYFGFLLFILFSFTYYKINLFLTDVENSKVEFLKQKRNVIRINHYYLFNSYLYKIPGTEKSYILIDTLSGQESFKNKIISTLEENKISKDDVKLIYLTHSQTHHDHAGNSLFFQNYFNTSVLIHNLESDNK